MKWLTRVLRWVLYYFLVLVGLSFLSLFYGTEWLGELFLLLPFGWTEFVARSYPRLTINLEATLVFLLAGIAFCFGLHQLLRWGTKERGEDGTTTPGWRLSWSLTIAVLVWVSFLAGISIVGISHQIVWLMESPKKFEKQPDGLSVRPSALAAQSMNRLKQICWSLQNYVSSTKTLPPSAVVDDNAEPLHSWATVLLPYLEERELYQAIDLKRPWNDPANLPAMKHEVDGFINPRVVYEENALPPIHYAANDKLLRAGSKLRPQDIRDGSSRTILFGEAAGNYKPWGQPGNWRNLELGLNKSRDGFGCPFLRGTCFVMADGSTRRLDDDVDPEVLKALSTPAGGEEFIMPPDIYLPQGD
jgi:hypothetical protein